MAVRGDRPDPEVQAGRALRRLRLSQQWSQEEVARRMDAYGYDFHQTMIAKIEAAQRPLRVRELADFAALYGVEVQELFYPPSGSLAEINEEIAEVEEQYAVAQQQAGVAAHERRAAQIALQEAEQQYRANSAAVATLQERLAILQREREKVARWEPAEDLASRDADGFDLKPNPLRATAPAEFVATLRQYRAWSGNPTLRTMAQRAEQLVVHSTMHAAMRSDALPRLDVVRAIIIGCGGSEDDLQAFATAWRRIATGSSRGQATLRGTSAADPASAR